MKITLLESISISEEYLLKFKERLQKEGHEFVYYNERTEDEKELISRIGDSDIIILTNIPINKNILEECPDLKMISVAFTGVDHIDLETCKKNNIIVCNSSGYANQAVAELTFGLSISLLRNIKECDQAVRKGKTRKGLIGNELKGKKLGIIGTGEIGLEVAKLGAAFGCDLLGYDKVENKEAKKVGIKYLELDELLQNSDIITVHLPLTAGTEHFIDSKRIKKIKPGAIFINAARGPIVDYEALIEAIEKGDIRGAGLDVFDREPPLKKSNPVFGSENVLLTPHIGFATQEAFNKRAKIVFENIFCWLKGEVQNKMV
ncbi:MAG: NAD(P)-dependent oxidoreductase [Halothermotrichaceae bacterium]